MSRQIVSNQGELTQIIDNRFTTGSRTPHRTLVVIELAPPQWLENYARNAEIKFIAPDVLADRADRISALLGQEHQVLAHTLNEPMDAGLLAALAGTISNGGVLLIALPYGVSPHDEDSDLERHSVTHFSSRFKKLVLAAANESPNEIALLKFNAKNPIGIVGPDIPAVEIPISPAAQTADLAKKEQDILLTQACDYLTKPDKSCISIIGKRGRGKTSLLARIANWIHESPYSYTVTALNKSAINSFYKQTNHESETNFQTAAGIQRRPHHIVLVDEAANLPVSVLSSLIHTHDKVVFCTTVEGYESAGRAFQTRFSEQVANTFQHPLTLSPFHPWRWLQNDPIEKLIDKLVLNSSLDNVAEDGDETRLPAEVANSDVQILQLTQRSLSNSESQLHKVYGLLRDTHYQTNVKDLQHLLDGQDLQIWALEHVKTKTLLAVAIVVIEREIESTLHSAVVEKKRRLPHHLLAQLLAQSANTANPLSRQFARVTRISVARSHRRLGLGSMLLLAIEHALLSSFSNDHDIDAMGASFAKDPASVQFWLRNGYTEFHEGFRQNPRTGLPSSAVLKSRQTEVQQALHMAAEIHKDNQSWRQHNEILSFNDQERLPAQATVSDRELLQQFVKGHRSSHDTFAAICRLMNKHKLSINSDDAQSKRAQEKALRLKVESVLNS